MENNNNMHIRRLVTVNITEELNKYKVMKATSLVDLTSHKDLPLVVSLEELAIQCGIQMIGLDRFSLESN